jgi:4-hydroxythreonine-4-phosphate dehydrogenase
MLRLSITCGDINGIGPEISIKAINKIYKPGRRKINFFCPANVFEYYSSILKPAFDFQISKSIDSSNKQSEIVSVIDIGKTKIDLGKSTALAGAVSFKAIKSAFDSIQKKYADAIITAPVSKTSLLLAGIDYPGQTEIFAYLCKSKKYMMIFLSSKMICGLATIHEPIKNVSRLITKKRLELAINILNETLRNDLGIKSPLIALLGLNPHAGEKGKIGKEELEIIDPLINSLSNKINIDGAFVPDAFFATKQYLNFDAVLGMYHDQLLIPFKMMNFNRGVNFTAGLPLIRTSPDHGTAYDIAGKGIADESSMVEAVKWAEKIIINRKK